MPLYEYQCDRGHKFEEFKHMDDRYNVVCPCGAPAHIMVSRFSFRLGTPLKWVSDGKVIKEVPDMGVIPGPGEAYPMEA